MNYSNSRIDLNGYDQLVTTIATNKIKQSASATFGFTSATKAKFRLVGTSIEPFGMQWAFYDHAGFEWDPPDPDVTFVHSNAVSATRGELAVTSGKYKLILGASFTALSEFSVGSGATFEVESGAGQNFTADVCTIADGAKLSLASGVNLKVGSLTVGGTTFAVGTVLSSSTHPSLITGDGTVTVALPRNTWQGASGGSWTNAANWSLGDVPSENCEAYIGSGMVTVDSATPKAGVITVASGATITCSGPFTNEADKATLHLVCGELNVQSGGKIDATQKGWSGALWLGIPTVTSSTTTWKWTYTHALGYGPGVSSESWCGYSGADHGGLGGSMRVLDRIRVPYGDAAHPTTAGSGGDLPISYGGEVQRKIVTSDFGYCRGCSGGGVIRIEATGSVRVDGEIRADGKGHANSGASRDCASAGGSVWITCRTISGSVTISAAGGSQGDPRFPFYKWRGFDSKGALVTDGRFGHPGGGGRIAVWTGASHYLAGDYKAVKLAQRPDSIADVFDATAGDPIFLGSETRNESQMAVLMGKDGTVAFGNYIKKPRMTVMIR